MCVGGVCVCVGGVWGCVGVCVYVYVISGPVFWSYDMDNNYRMMYQTLSP